MADRSNLAAGLAVGGLVPNLAREFPVICPDGPEAVVASLSGGHSFPENQSALCWLEGGMAVLDSGGHILQVNESLAGWFEKTISELEGGDFWRLLTTRCPSSAPVIETLRCDGVPFRDVVLRNQSTSGGTSEASRLEVAHHPSGSFIRMGSVLPGLGDLEESGGREYPLSEPVQRQLFARLVRAEAQLKLLTEQWPGVVFSQRADFSFRFVSPRIEVLTGVPEREWQSGPHLFWQVVHESDAAELRHQLAQARETREPMTMTYRLRHLKTGRIVYVMEHRRLNLSPGGLVLGYEGVWLDVTRQTLAERRLTSAAWKEVLSVLTMGLAHDFGNVMAGIHALTESFVDQVGDRPEFVDGLKVVKQSARQASHLVQRMINLHQGRTGEVHYHDLNEIVADVADLARKIIPRRMKLKLELCPQPLPGYFDAVELRQVALGLILNAVDAMSPEGSLLIQTKRSDEPPRSALGIGMLPRWPAVGLSIGDNGKGISPEHLKRLCEPFFTTKPSHKGSGLGLYNARVFAERHRGAVLVDSVVGEGSTISLLLPEADFTEAGAESASQGKIGSIHASDRLRLP